MRPTAIVALLPLLAASCVSAFPSMARVDAMERSRIQEAMQQAREVVDLMKREQVLQKRQDTNAAPVMVPDPNDTEHQFQEPGPTDQRGPCPGMNTLANHGYLPRSGIVTFLDLIKGQKEGYNIDYDLGAALAAIAVSLDGDLLTTKLSLGGQDDRTMLLGNVQSLVSHEPGLNGHNTFEGDTSLTRRDYYLNNGDDFTFQGEMYADMKSYAEKYGADGKYDVTSMATYRSLRYNQSRADNDRFYYGPKSFLLYGASSFVYAAFGNATEDPTFLSATEPSVSSFFGAVADSSAPGGYRHVAERFPPNWYQRTKPYTLLDVVREVAKQYGQFPVQFGANARNMSGRFFAPTAPSDQPFFVVPTNDAEVADYCCAIFQLLFEDLPATVATPALLLQSQLDFWLGTFDPVFKDSCNCQSPNSAGKATTTDSVAELLLPKPGADAMNAGTAAVTNAINQARSSL